MENRFTFISIFIHQRIITGRLRLISIRNHHSLNEILVYHIVKYTYHSNQIDMIKVSIQLSQYIVSLSLYTVDLICYNLHSQIDMLQCITLKVVEYVSVAICDNNIVIPHVFVFGHICIVCNVLNGSLSTIIDNF